MENQRFEYRTPVQIIIDRLEVPAVAPSAPVKGYIRELSASGCRLESELKLELGNEVSLNFVLPGGLALVNVHAKVIRIFKSRHGLHFAGCQFVNLPESDQYKIREYVVYLEAHGEGPK